MSKFPILTLVMLLGTAVAVHADEAPAPPGDYRAQLQQCRDVEGEISQLACFGAISGSTDFWISRKRGTELPIVEDLYFAEIMRCDEEHRPMERLDCFLATSAPSSIRSLNARSLVKELLKSPEGVDAMRQAVGEARDGE
ncbi:hypothetical protein ACQ5SP_01950 [Rhodovulum sp. YNF3179]|uniref:hypothetical protein n=1 Tax=Rhodovulum sp. YNF3179 TaxID=3425127 RepID=UPI003D357478